MRALLLLALPCLATQTLQQAESRGAPQPGAFHDVAQLQLFAFMAEGADDVAGPDHGLCLASLVIPLRGIRHITCERFRAAPAATIRWYRSTMQNPTDGMRNCWAKGHSGAK